MKDIVEAALANATTEADAVDVSAFGPVRIAVVGVGERGRERVAHVRATAETWGDGADQVATGVAPVGAPGTAPLRPHPDEAAPDLDATDLLLATAHVHAAADVERLRLVAGRASPDAVTVAIPTLSADTRETAAGVAAELLRSCDAVVPVAAERVTAAPVTALDGRDSPDPVDAVAGALAVALAEGLVVGAHRPLTPHVPVLSVLAGGGRGRAHVGAAGPETPLEELAGAVLDGPLADLDGGPVAGVVTHLLADDGVTLSAAEAFEAAVEAAAGLPDDEAVPHYVGVRPALPAGSDRRAVVVVFDGA